MMVINENDVIGLCSMYLRWEFRIRAACKDKLMPFVFFYEPVLPNGYPFFASGYDIEKNYIGENAIKCCPRAFNGALVFPNGSPCKMKFSSRKISDANQ